MSDIAKYTTAAQHREHATSQDMRVTFRVKCMRKLGPTLVPVTVTRRVPLVSFWDWDAGEMETSLKLYTEVGDADDEPMMEVRVGSASSFVTTYEDALAVVRRFIPANIARVPPVVDVRDARRCAQPGSQPGLQPDTEPEASSPEPLSKKAKKEGPRVISSYADTSEETSKLLKKIRAKVAAVCPQAADFVHIVSFTQCERDGVREVVVRALDVPGVVGTVTMTYGLCTLCHKPSLIKLTPNVGNGTIPTLKVDSLVDHMKTHLYVDFAKTKKKKESPQKNTAYIEMLGKVKFVTLLDMKKEKPAGEGVAPAAADAVDAGAFADDGDNEDDDDGGGDAAAAAAAAAGPAADGDLE